MCSQSMQNDEQQNKYIKSANYVKKILLQIDDKEIVSVQAPQNPVSPFPSGEKDQRHIFLRVIHN